MSKLRIFVFGSNLAGRHGKGAAKYARLHRGAVYGQGEGFQGQSYAIPTKNEALGPLALETIRTSVGTFKGFAHTNSGLIFFVTRIGCGEAGYKDWQVAPLFRGAPENCHFPEEWRPYLQSDVGPRYHFYRGRMK